jgi:hypothetical protein
METQPQGRRKVSPLNIRLFHRLVSSTPRFLSYASKLVGSQVRENEVILMTDRERPDCSAATAFPRNLGKCLQIRCVDAAASWLRRTDDIDLPSSSEATIFTLSVQSTKPQLNVRSNMTICLDEPIAQVREQALLSAMVWVDLPQPPSLSSFLCSLYHTRCI